MSASNQRVAVLGCGGIGQVISTVIRRAVYMAEQERPEQVAIIGSGPVTGDVPEVLDTARRHPLIVINGCAPRCASVMAEGKGLGVDDEILAGDVMARHRISLAGEKREQLGENGMALARAMADEIIARVDALLSDQAEEGEVSHAE